MSSNTTGSGSRSRSRAPRRHPATVANEAANAKLLAEKAAEAEVSAVMAEGTEGTETVTPETATPGEDLLEPAGDSAPPAEDDSLGAREGIETEPEDEGAAVAEGLEQLLEATEPAEESVAEAAVAEEAVIEAVAEVIAEVTGESPDQAMTDAEQLAEDVITEDGDAAEGDGTLEPEIPAEDTEAPAEDSKDSEDGEKQAELTEAEQNKIEARKRVAELQAALEAAQAAAGITPAATAPPAKKEKAEKAVSADTVIVTKRNGEAGDENAQYGERIMIAAYSTPWDNNGKPRAFRILELPSGVVADDVIPMGATIALYNRDSPLSLGTYVRVDPALAPKPRQMSWVLTTSKPQHVTLPGSDAPAEDSKDSKAGTELVAASAV